MYFSSSSWDLQMTLLLILFDFYQFQLIFLVIFVQKMSIHVLSHHTYTSLASNRLAEIKPRILIVAIRFSSSILQLRVGSSLSARGYYLPFALLPSSTWNVGIHTFGLLGDIVSLHLFSRCYYFNSRRKSISCTRECRIRERQNYRQGIISIEVSYVE